MTDTLTIADTYGISVDVEAELARDEKERWRCTDDSAATWLLRKLGEAEAALESKRLQLEAENERLNRWIAEVTAPLVRDRDFFRGSAERYMAERFAETGEKTVKLPTGELTARKAPDRLEVDDEERFVAWAIAHERRDLLSVKVSVKARETKDALEPVTGDPWYAPTSGEIAVAVEWSDDDSICRVVHWDGIVVDLADDASDWERVPADALILPAPTDDDGRLTGPALVAPGVSLIVGEPVPKARAALS